VPAQRESAAKTRMPAIEVKAHTYRVVRAAGPRLAPRGAGFGKTASMSTLAAVHNARWTRSLGTRLRSRGHQQRLRLVFHHCAMVVGLLSGIPFCLPLRCLVLVLGGCLAFILRGNGSGWQGLKARIWPPNRVRVAGGFPAAGCIGAIPITPGSCTVIPCAHG
jgi:hypothetical protein